MIKQALPLVMLTIPPGATGACRTDQPEIGDIGPDSELVCKELVSRFPRADLAVTGRVIRSAKEVSVGARVDGRPLALHYVLSGYRWQLASTGDRLAQVIASRARLSEANGLKPIPHP
jgi:hypothetical protein